MPLVRIFAVVACAFMGAQQASAAALTDGDKKAEPLQPAAAKRQTPCASFSQKRLFISRSLNDKRLYLTPTGELQVMPFFDEAPDRLILHRSHALSSESIENISIYKTQTADTCVLNHNPDENTALKLPVFFIGRRGGPEDDLQQRAKRLQFDGSKSVDKGDSFDTVAFRLRHGGSLFNEIRPFFRCGLAGLLVCEGSCPVESFALSGKLVEAVVNGEATPTSSERREAANKRAVLEAQQKAAQAQGAAPAPVVPTPPPVVAPTPKPQPAPTPPQAPTPAPVPQPSPPLPEKPAEAPIPPAASNPPAPAPEIAPRPTPLAASPEPASKKLTFTFEKSDGTPLSALDVEQAEGALVFEGVRFAVGADGYSANVSEEVAAKASDFVIVSKMLRHHRTIAVKSRDAGQIVVTVEPLYVRADDLTLALSDAAGNTVQNCALKLLPIRGRGLGAGWAKVAALPQSRGSEAVQFTHTGASFELERPETIPENELLLDTAADGPAITLSSPTAGCAFKESPFVTAEELRTLDIKRSLRSTGPLLMVIVATDSNLAPAILAPNVEGFWAQTLELVAALSSEGWERKILARAQYPGVNSQTQVLTEAGVGKALEDNLEQRARDIQLLSKGSEPLPGPQAIFQSAPVERYDLDLALKIIRKQANILEVQSQGQEALLVISGGDQNANHCRRAIRGEFRDNPKPKWMQNARRIVFVDLWDDATFKALLQEGGSEDVDGAANGVARCKIGGADGEKIKHYGLSYATIKDEAARKAAFAFLSMQIKAFLQP